MHSYISLIEENAIWSYNYFVNKEKKDIIANARRKVEAMSICKGSPRQLYQGSSKDKSEIMNLQNNVSIADEKEKNPGIF